MQNNATKLTAYCFALAILWACSSCKSVSQNGTPSSEKRPDNDLSSEVAKKILGVSDERPMFEGMNA